MVRTWLSASLLAASVLLATPALAQPADAPADGVLVAPETPAPTEQAADAEVAPADAPAAPPIAVAPPAPIAAPGAVAMLPPPPPPGPAYAGSDDANSGRAWMMPTALSSKAGTWSFTDYELVLMGASYALTDDFSISAGTMVPIAEDQPLIGTLNAKVRIVHTARTHVALQAGLLFAADGDGGDDAAMAGNAGAVATFCGDDVCSSHASVYVGTVIAQVGDAEKEALLVASGEVTARLGASVKGVVELDLGRSRDGSVETGVLAWYGLRFHSAQIGVDVGFAKPINPDTDGEFPIGVPWVNFQYRGLR
ncbi:MAG: hypothetical protein K8W52_40465 [Deltaproteobacteria bacterium]|nr:hypothetical protein [Deltaproteobacteria bacterium]